MTIRQSSLYRGCCFVALTLAAVVLPSCASSNGPARTCDCADTTLQANGSQRGIAGSPLTTIVCAIVEESYVDVDTSYNDIFAEPYSSLGSPTSVLDVGTVTVDTIVMELQTDNGVTRYGGRFPWGTLSGNSTIRYAVEGRGSVAPYQADMFVSGPLNLKVNGVAGKDLGDTLALGQDLRITWDVSSEQPSIVLMELEVRNLSGRTLISLDLSGPDDGERLISAASLQPGSNFATQFILYAERSYTRCSCQSSMQYNLVSFSQDWIYRFTK